MKQNYHKIKGKEAELYKPKDFQSGRNISEIESKSAVKYGEQHICPESFISDTIFLRYDCFYAGGHRLVSVGYSVVSNARAVMKDKGNAMRCLCVLMYYPFILLCVQKETLNDRPRDSENNSGAS